MTMRLLIAYATATDSTTSIANSLAETLTAGGFEVDVRSITDNPEVNAYQAVIIGSAVQFGTWLPEAIDFVKQNQRQLSQIPVALFCVHVQNMGNDAASRQKRHAYLNAVRSYVRPVDEAYFGGRFNREGAAIMFPKWLSRFIPATDFRNWDRVRAWGNSIARKLQQDMVKAGLKHEPDRD